MAIVTLFLYRKDDPDSKDNQGRKTLSRAAANGAEAVVKLLLDCQVDANCKDIEGEITLSNAAKSGNVAVIQLLSDRNVDVESKDKWARLHYGCQPQEDMR